VAKMPLSGIAPCHARCIVLFHVLSYDPSQDTFKQANYAHRPAADLHSFQNVPLHIQFTTKTGTPLAETTGSAMSNTSTQLGIGELKLLPIAKRRMPSKEDNRSFPGTCW